MQIVASCEHVSRIFKPGKLEVRALDDVSLNIEEGEMLVVMGPSGSGKSTLLNLIGCLDKPTSGRVLIGGIDSQQRNKRELAKLRNEKIGFIFQSFHLIPVLTAFENVEFALQIQGKHSKRKRHELVMSVLESLDIAELANRRPSEMSGGQQQRVAIARALVKKPLLILADEPTANLDSKTTRSIVELMIKLNEKEGTTFLLSTHDPLVMEAVPRLVRLRDGRIVEDNREG